MSKKGEYAVDVTELEKANARIKELGSTPALVITIAINRLTGFVTFANNIEEARVSDDIEQAVNALEVIVRELRREQLRLAEERGKKAVSSNGHKT